MGNITRREREKLMHEGEIIQAAEEVFRLKGFDRASMDEIAEQAQFTKRTLYQYFASKEDLFFAVMLKGYQQLQDHVQAITQEGTSGFEKIEQIFQKSYQFYQTYPEVFRLMSYVGKARQKAAEAGSSQQEYLKMNARSFHDIAALIAQGQADGSIRKDLNPEKTAYSLVFVMTGFFNQLSVSGKSFSTNFSLDVDALSRSTIQLLLSTIQNK